MSEIVTIDGPLGPFKIPTGVHPRTREVCEQLSRQVFAGEYDAPELPGSVRDVIDIGAGWGAFAVWGIARWPGINLTCYEPHEAAAAVLCENLAEIHYPGPVGAVHAIRRAVTTNPNPKLNGCEDWGAYHVAPPDDTCAWPVPVVHPRELLPCDVLKVDAEGCEGEILEHYRHVAKCRALLIEWHSPELRRRTNAVALRNGFRCVKCPVVDVSFGVSIWVK